MTVVKYVRARTQAVAESKATNKHFVVSSAREVKSARRYHGMKQYCCTMRRRKNLRGNL